MARRTLAIRIRGREQPAADLDPRRLGLGRPDQPCCDIPSDFGQLVLINGNIGAARRSTLPAKRQQHRESRRSGHQSKDKP